MKTFRFAVQREGDLFPQVVAIVTAVVNDNAITNQEELLSELRAGVTAWIRSTKEGKKAWRDSVQDFNIGDLMNYDFEPILAHCPNIESLEVDEVDVSDHWLYDTVLADDPEEDAYESSS
jgi:hypothetical protein